VSESGKKNTNNNIKKIYSPKNNSATKHAVEQYGQVTNHHFIYICSKVFFFLVKVKVILRTCLCIV